MISFSKYHGAGNDFIVVDDREQRFPLLEKELISRLCNRHTGIGADGLILLQPSQKAQIRMRIFNADGGEAEMCGNGIRCLFHFARSINACEKRAEIETMASTLLCTQEEGELISVLHPIPQLISRDLLVQERLFDLVDSGVPHALHLVKDIHEVEVDGVGRRVRHDPQFFPGGTNVTFVQPHLEKGLLLVRTYERGVEGETQACGTAAVAAAFIASKKLSAPRKLKVQTLSKVIFETELKEKGVELKGPAELIFEGKFETGRSYP
ncbi:MAG: diaminopimelate epimerase [Chlamydiales bacterium]|nr:diaminopimelate epimerase [Chlamydiales bacterium]